MWVCVYSAASIHTTPCVCVCVFRETNLKVRQALTETSVMADDIQQLSSFNGLTQTNVFLLVTLSHGRNFQLKCGAGYKNST